jgi:hypothetical protein
LGFCLRQRNASSGADERSGEAIREFGGCAWVVPFDGGGNRCSQAHKVLQSRVEDSDNINTTLSFDLCQMELVGKLTRFLSHVLILHNTTYIEAKKVQHMGVLLRSGGGFVPASI